MKTFNEFVDKKAREAQRQLKIVEKLLRHHGMQAKGFYEHEDEPYVFVKNPGGQTSFDGVRIYKIAGTMAYRIQKEATTHPYGTAYQLDIEGMYSDLIGDKIHEKKAGESVMRAIMEEIQKFFKNSAAAEKDLRASEFDKNNDPWGNVMMKSAQGTDYSNLINSKS